MLGNDVSLDGHMLLESGGVPETAIHDAPVKGLSAVKQDSITKLSLP